MEIKTDAKSAAVETFIRQVCKEKMNVEVPDRVDPSHPIEQAFELDSISMFELIVNLEEEYGIRIADAEVEQVGNMNLVELASYLERRQASG
ncbi:acyl carrier protein [Xylanibacillus composti]|uniref:Carrier domain-containing protein n=1 Tax=Xylanibacillus composti TaxID=1572762 RepID=A0A8J4H550_9BACL|nr:acyl carrier protein [Xylanibacillus composti]MDT9727116.1 acyl carrier protein [Xylanibacillus composti]GIQ68873.1 hypothetical protein XYCOK13_16970 [Xylanibacillus composti]